MSNDIRWHVWTIAVNKYSEIEKFLDGVIGVKELLYPTIKEEYNTKAGVKKKNVPLYSNYLFIKYKDSNELKASLENCVWMYNYLGECSQEEIKKVRKLDGKKLSPISKLRVGMRVKLVGTPFKSLIATIIGIDGNKLVVSVDIFGAERVIKCLISDVDMEGGGV
jgi:transcription antitermination factor NusG